MKKTVKEFFAASNSYSGFVSYFEEIFNPKDYEKIFILKGGPGTGKSSFMRNIAAKCENLSLSCQKILCSSDPDSLDGLIIENDGKKIALLDGTAPHSTDPKIPGAIEKIINLGDSWNEALLTANREKIIKLSAAKSEHYKNAYSYLSVAGLCVKYVDTAILDTIDTDIKDILEDVFLNTKDDGGTAKNILTSSFGKRGFHEIEGLGDFAERKINIVGIYGSEYYFMKRIAEEARRRSLSYIASPSPLDREKTDAIYIFSNLTSVSVGNKHYIENAKLIDTSKYINLEKLNSKRSLLETLYKEREAMLWCATDEFKKAYDMHIEAEKIYTASMDFKNNIKLSEKVFEEIIRILLPEVVDDNTGENQE